MSTSLREVSTNEANEAARRRLLSVRGDPLFYADWERAVFIHYEVDAAALQREVPFALDLREGRAYVSLVAFTMRGMRLRFGGRLGEWLCKPIATHEFLNVRTYVRHQGEPGIFFMTEWLSNPLSVYLGPKAFGLPYRLGQIEYWHKHETAELEGKVQAARSTRCLRYAANVSPDAAFGVCPGGSTDEYLLERYTAFTCPNRKRRFFRIWHRPWLQCPIEIKVLDCSLITSRWQWFHGSKLIGANYSPGARNVWMGWPHKINS